MANFKNEAVIDYPVKDVFKVILKAAKRDFSNFNKDKAIGTKITKSVGAYSNKTGTMEIEITDFKENEVYEITSSQGLKVIRSKYSFEPVEGNKTRFILEESENSTGFISGINSLIVGVIFKKRIKRRFSFLIKGLEAELGKSAVEV